MKNLLLFLLLVALLLGWAFRGRLSPREKVLAQSVSAVVSGSLVTAAGEPVAADYLAEQDLVLVYFSAHWCPPCRAFTPELVRTYNSLKPGNRFEVLFVSSDRSRQDMMTYMRETKMPWPGVRHGSQAAATLGASLAGQGIPCLVMIDAAGNVVSDSYRGSRYVGPQVVLDDLVARLKNLPEQGDGPRLAPPPMGYPSSSP